MEKNLSPKSPKYFIQSTKSSKFSDFLSPKEKIFFETKQNKKRVIRWRF